MIIQVIGKPSSREAKRNSCAHKRQVLLRIAAVPTIIYWQTRARVVSLSPINVNQILTCAVDRKKKTLPSVNAIHARGEKTNWFIALRLQCPLHTKKKIHSVPAWVSSGYSIFRKTKLLDHNAYAHTHFLAALKNFFFLILITSCRHNLFILIPKIALSFLSPRLCLIILHRQ